MLGLVFGACGLYYFFLGGKERRWWFRRSFRENALADKEVEFLFDRAGLTVHSPLYSGTADWAVIRRVVETPDGFLIIITPPIFYWIPIHAFVSPDGPDAFEQLAREHAPRYVVRAPRERSAGESVAMNKPLATLDDEL